LALFEEKVRPIPNAEAQELDAMLTRRRQSTAADAFI
jgi:hypothetical protein